MTAEVAIMNKLAVALAADSAVTTGYPGREKIFTGANKIFTLSKHAPVGVMINGHVEHFGIPWELLIKTFRAELGTNREPTVEAYAQRLKEYISADRFITDEGQAFSVIVAVYSAYGEIRKRLSNKGQNWNSKNINSVLEDMERFLYENCPYIDQFHDVTYQKFIRRYKTVLNESIQSDDLFARKIPGPSRSKFKYIVYLSLVHNLPGRFATGIVVAGYGEDEIFPTIKEMTFDGGIMGIMRCVDGVYYDIGRDTDAEPVFLSGFAQDDAVNAFRDGVDDDYKRYSQRMTSSFLGDFAEELLKTHTSYSAAQRRVVLRAMQSKISDSVEDFTSVLEKFSHDRFDSPITEVLRSAPKDELASVAESLVSLTALKRRISPERETVGGPIDVAVISKGDGFIWIKRKHYFSPDLNYHFMHNYFDHGGRHGE